MTEHGKEYTETLEEKIKLFEEERERVRSIIGQVGGKPTLLRKFSNIIFIVLVAAAFLLSLIAKGYAEVLMLEIIILLVSTKFIYFLFIQARVVHFQFWILSSMEWRINEIADKLDKMIAIRK